MEKSPITPKKFNKKHKDTRYIVMFVNTVRLRLKTHK